ncbi:hypothetical protein MKK75_17005 [Methylobacterium sp. J-030]|uniref:hypothetical protein n=1 Tax=Methylobacterium sp. J-030 TaxID=2836627 RepID=UPI001FB94B85|nr:hypothetical protein [Methylobacterium sp. J-030]MCJ2070476.1 hypothetical protein [Methylobacterium sp. J-030]
MKTKTRPPPAKEHKAKKITFIIDASNIGLSKHSRPSDDAPLASSQNYNHRYSFGENAVAQIPIIKVKLRCVADATAARAITIEIDLRCRAFLEKALDPGHVVA